MSDSPALAGVQMVADIDAADDFQKKHTPYVEVDSKDGASVVTVKVGYWVSHPNTLDHYIGWIEILANGAPVARYEMSPTVVDPEITCVLHLDPGTTLRVLESCNLHGVWASEVTV